MTRPAPVLDLRDYSVAVADRPIVRGVTLRVNAGEVHAIMGPNGAGKSTLVSALMGHPALQVTDGSATLLGEDLLALTTDERARRGLFLAMQYPKEIAGVPLERFLLAAAQAQRAARSPEQGRWSPVAFRRQLHETMRALQMDTSFAERAVNRGFSGGEKKKAEVLQMTMLRPRLALLDETDSGLDVDALRIVADGVNRLRGPEFSAVVVTHYARLLHGIIPDRVHVMVRGSIVESGGPELAERLEREGYARYGISESIQLDVSSSA